MIGSAKITYTNENVCDLVRKDLVDKFGNRELANYNLYLPGVVTPKAVITAWPNPDVKVTSVEEQIEAMGVRPKQPVYRDPNSVEVVLGLFDSPISSTFDHRTRELIVSGGPVSWTSAEESGQEYAAHWYGISIGFPLGLDYEEDRIIPYTMNGTPQFHIVTSDEADNSAIVILCDAKYTTMNLNITWCDLYGPELISCICNASLASKAVDKIPAFPTEPKFEFKFPDTTTESLVQVDVDLDLGK